MKKSIFSNISLLVLVFSATTLFAQMPTDAIFMPKKSLCAAAIYGNNSWTNYWEGTLKRDNQNIGKNITQSFSLMAAYGVSDKLNIIVNAPYITTHNTAGNLLGQKGLQDFSAFLKYKIYTIKDLSFIGLLGGSVPMSNYVPDFLPMSIGLQSKNAMGKAIVNYQHKTGLYATAHAGYTLRSNITIDRDSYKANGKVYNSNEVEVPHAVDAAFRIGYLKPKFQTELFYTYFSCVKGDNIYRQDMPFPTNLMRSKAIGWYGKFQPKNIGVNASVSYVLAGQNVGQSLMYNVGLLWQLNFNRKS